MKKKRIGAFVLAGCMLFSQVAWAQEPMETGTALSQVEEVPEITPEVEESETVQDTKDAQEEITEKQLDITEESANTSSENMAEEVSNNDAFTAEVMSVKPTEEQLYENMHKQIRLLLSELNCDWTIESDNSDVCSAEMKLVAQSSENYYDHYVKLITRNAGEANVKVYNNKGREYVYHVTVSERPEGSVVFRDANLEAELLSSCDEDRNGLISKEELAGKTYLDLQSCSISDIEGLKYAENLEKINLNYNALLENIEPLLELNNLKEISVRKTGLSVDYKWKFVKFNTEADLFLGDDTDLITNGDFFEPSEIMIEKVSGDDIYKIKSESYPSSIIANGVGEEVIKISSGSNSQIINVKVKGALPDQKVGEASDATLERIDENIILSSNGELWSLYPKTEKLSQNVKRYAAGWVYSGRDAEKYAYQLCEDDTLLSDNIKVAENIKDFSGHYALDEDGNLIDLYNTKTTAMIDVQLWKEYEEVKRTYNFETGKWERTSRQWCYALKKDGTLWKREEVGRSGIVNEFEKITENVEMLNDTGYLYMDGKYISFSGDTILENVKSMLSERCYLDRNGHTQYRYGYTTWVDFGEINIVDSYGDYHGTYFLTDSGEIYELDSKSENKLKKVLEHAKQIKDGPNEVLYQGEDGLWRKVYDQKAGTIEEPITLQISHIKISNMNYQEYHLEDYGALDDYNVTKNGVLILNHVKGLFYLANGACALRTDGTLWNITTSQRMILDLNSGTAVPGDVNGDGEVNIQDLRLILRHVCGKEEFDTSELYIADVNEDGTVDIQDLRKVLRYVCGKDESL